MYEMCQFGIPGARNVFVHICWQAEASGVCRWECGHGFRWLLCSVVFSGTAWDDRVGNFWAALLSPRLQGKGISLPLFLSFPWQPHLLPCLRAEGVCRREHEAPEGEWSCVWGWAEIKARLSEGWKRKSKTVLTPPVLVILWTPSIHSKSKNLQILPLSTCRVPWVTDWGL